jgi:hypothetical protein
MVAVKWDTGGVLSTRMPRDTMEHLSMLSDPQQNWNSESPFD